MDDNIKWLIIGFMVVFSVAFGAIGFKEYNNTKAGIEFSKQGLEECRKVPDGMNTTTIWVKSCKEYYIITKEMEK